MKKKLGRLPELLSISAVKVVGFILCIYFVLLLQNNFPRRFRQVRFREV
jgi:hypothetical protein